AANAELRGANEEFLVGSEEMQAAMEEVETLNEEMHATNEELETVNEELQATVEELHTTNDDLEARNLEMRALAAEREEQRQRSEAERARLAAVLLSMGAEGAGEGGVVVVRDGTERSVRGVEEEFLALGSHELRTRLAPIRGYLTLLGRLLQTEGTDERARH